MKYNVGDEFIEIAEPNSGFIIEPVTLSPDLQITRCDFTNEVNNSMKHYYGTHFFNSTVSGGVSYSTPGLFFSEATLDTYFIIRNKTTEVLFAEKD